jgi:uncharacterized repeat protein (TIGR01451 family)
MRAGKRNSLGEQMKGMYKLAIILIITYSCITPVFADETEWVDPRENTLRMTESFIRDGFQIEATDFFDNTALITVYDNGGNLVTRNLTRINDSFVVNDRLNITIVNLQEAKENIGAGHGVNVTVDQWVRIETRVSGVPSIKLAIIPKGIEIQNRTIIMQSYVPGSEIAMNFSIRNDGKAKLRNITLTINTSMQVLYNENLNYDIYDLDAGNESDPITVHFQAPYTYEPKSVFISAKVIGNDILGNAYDVTNSAFVEIMPQFNNKIDVVKYVPEKVYMGDEAIVSLVIKNNGSRKLDNMSLTDSLQPGLLPIDTNLTWNLSLGPFEQKEISYMVKPQKPGIYTFLPGSSIIEYNGLFDYNQKPSKLIVNGPYVILMKSANTSEPSNGETINVTVEAKNAGDATAIVKLSDAVPTNHTLENQMYDTISDTLVLHPGKSAAITYSLLASAAGNFILPPAKAIILDKIFYQDERYTQMATSSELTIRVGEPLKVPSITTTPVPAKSVNISGREMNVSTATTTTHRSTPGFEGYIFIIVSMVIFIIKKLESRKSITQPKGVGMNREEHGKLVDKEA